MKKPHVQSVDRLRQPRNEAGLARFALVAGSTALAVMGIGITAENVVSASPDLPERVAVVKHVVAPRDTLSGYVQGYAKEHRVDAFDVIEDTINQSPTLQDGGTSQYGNLDIGDVAYVPATDKQIADGQSITIDPHNPPQ